MKQLLLTLITFSVVLCACSKKSDKPAYTIDQAKISLNYDKTHQFEVKQGSNIIAGSSLTWTSSDQAIGTVSAHGFFTANKIGTTTITATNASGSASAEVIINPYSTLCKEPVLEFGATFANIKSKESRGLLEEVSAGLVYAGENTKIRAIMYLFDDNRKMTSAAILLANNPPAVIAEAGTFFSERYTYQGVEENIVIFTGTNLIVAMSYDNTLGYVALYLNNASGAGVATKAARSVIKKAYQEKLNYLKLKNIIK